jgi:hypothetical protein
MKSKGIKMRMLVPLFAFGLLKFVVSCNDKSSNPQGTFDVYGRIIYRPILAQPQSEAIFYLYHNGQGIRQALITVGSDTIPVVDSLGGYYHRNMAVSVGDTFSYKIISDFGSAEGHVTIPDTVTIIRLDTTIYVDSAFFAAWNQGIRVDGYFAYLEDQGGLVSVVRESPLDTSTTVPGTNIVQIGADRFWLETLSGAFSAAIAPGGKIMPKGVVGAAGNYREVYVAPQR